MAFDNKKYKRLSVDLTLAEKRELTDTLTDRMKQSEYARKAIFEKLRSPSPFDFQERPRPPQKKPF